MDLKSAILSAEIGRSRLTNIPSGEYKVEAKTDKNGKATYTLIGKGRRVPLSIESLAGLRITADPTKAKTFKTTSDAFGSDDVTTLQAALQKENATFSTDTTLHVVHKLRMIDSVSGKPIYQNRHYNKYGEFLKTTRDISLMPSETESEAIARRNAYRDANAALLASGVKSEVKEDDDNLQLMPVFQVKN